MDDASAVVSAVASFGLPGSEPPPRPPEDAWPAVGARIAASRLSGLALASIDVGWIEPPALVVDRLRSAQNEAMLWCLGLERRLLTLAARLRAGGVAPVVLKGPAVAHGVYPDPAWRPFLDADLLVAGDQRERASAILSAAGYPPARPEPRRGFDDRFGKAVVHRGADGAEIDLHRTIAQGPFAVWIDVDELLASTQPWTLAGQPMRRLDDTVLFVHACVHATLGSPRAGWVTLRDVAQTARRVDWDRATDIVARWRLGSVVRHAVSEAERRLGVPMPVRARQIRGQDDASTARALRSYAVRARSRGGPALEMVRALPSIRQRLAYVAALAMPTREFLDVREGSEGGALLRRWGRAARWAHGRDPSR